MGASVHPLFKAAAISLLSAVILIGVPGCSSDSNSSGGKPSTGNPVIPPPSTGGNIVLGSGYAWVNEDEGMGFIFLTGNKVRIIGSDDSGWVDVDTVSTYEKIGSDSISITSPELGGTLRCAYAVTNNGNTLTLTVMLDGIADNLVLTKMAVTIFIPTPPPPPPPVPPIVLGRDSAWVDIAQFPTSGYVFGSDGSALYIEVLASRSWSITKEGTYETVGADSIVFTWKLDNGGSNIIPGKYSVSDNGDTVSITLGLNGEEERYVRKKATLPNPLVLTDTSGWVALGGEGDTSYLFKADGKLMAFTDPLTFGPNEKLTGLGEGSYSISQTGASRGKITITLENGAPRTGTYYIHSPGNVITLTFGGVGKNLSKRTTLSVHWPITLDEGDVWLTTEDMGRSDGYVFFETGRVVYFYAGRTGNYSVDQDGTYQISSTARDSLTVTWNPPEPEPDFIKYTVSPDRQTLRVELDMYYNGERSQSDRNFKRTSGITVGGL
jgi:hypothetical protein